MKIENKQAPHQNETAMQGFYKEKKLAYCSHVLLSRAQALYKSNVFKHIRGRCTGHSQPPSTMLVTQICPIKCPFIQFDKIHEGVSSSTCWHTYLRGILDLFYIHFCICCSFSDKSLMSSYKA